MQSEEDLRADPLKAQHDALRRIVLPIFLLVLAACGDPQPPTGPPIIAYASLDDPANLPELFTAFTAETGIPVAANWGGSRANTDAVIGKQGPAADVLITANVADIWRAGEQGALRPLRGGAVAAVRDELKDPDALWVALEHRFAVIAISPHSDEQTSGGYGALASKSFRGRLCLTSLDNTINQAVIAMLIEDLGLKPAERVVRGWMMNLEMPPFATEESLVAAIESGDCEVGIISASAKPVGMKKIDPVPLYFEISGMGVGRHTSNPERAQQLIDWLILNKPLGGLAEWNGRNIGIAGWRNEDVILLAERAGYD